MDKIKEFSECLRYATEDFDSAEILFNQYRKPINVICYHCQQAAEKCLKGFLVSRGVEFERTHDLLRIIDECIKIEESFSAIVRYCMKLNPYSVITRYPSELELIDSDAESALVQARTIITPVNNHIIKSE